MQIGGEGGPCHAVRCCIYVCVYSVELANGGGVSWPGWDGGVTPRFELGLPGTEKSGKGKGIAHSCVEMLPLFS